MNKSNVQVFNFGKNEVRTNMDESNNIWFCLKDVCDVLSLTNSRKVSVGLDEKGVTISYIPTYGGTQGHTFINEPNLYRVIFQSRKPTAKQFQNWIFDEVIPSIRKTGSYTVTDNMPKTFPEALRAYADEVEKRELAEIRVKQLEPKAVGYESFIGKDNQDIYSFGDVAKLLTNNGFKKIGRNKLFQILREDKILMSSKNYRNLPYAKYQKYFSIKKVKIPHNTKPDEYTNQPYFTPAGIDFIRKHLINHHIDLLLNIKKDD